MTIETFTAVLSFFAVTLIWLFVCFKMVSSYRVDIYRSRMSELRGELFDFAAEGNISFDDPAYILLRRRIDLLIEHAHQITLFRIYAALAAQKLTGRSNTTNRRNHLDTCIESLSIRNTRAKLLDLQQRVDRASAKHLVRGSLPLTTAIACVACANIVVRQWHGVQETWCEACDRVLKGPIAPREIEHYAECVSS